MIPNFICPGFPKCGTTTLDAILKQHKNIYLPAVKETLFFDDEKAFNLGKEWYSKRYFREGNSSQVLGEVNPKIYLYPDRIKKVFPKSTKFIFIMRNPVDQTFSSFRMGKMLGVVFDDLKLNLVRNQSASFQNFIKKSFYYSEDYTNVRLKNHNKAALLNTGKYYENIKPYLKLYPSENFLFILFEDFIKDPSKECQKIFRFLNIEENININYNIKENEGGYISRNIFTLRFYKWYHYSLLSWFYRRFPYMNDNIYRCSVNFEKYIIKICNHKSKKKFIIPKETRKILENYFKEDKKEVEKLLNRDLSDIWF